jgi:membrane protein DedA with SNARE-associated domain/rhodanese-related sulfurtransferase
MATLLQLSYWGLFLAVLAQQVGLPVPSVVFLMAAGALVAHGKMHIGIVIVLSVVGCLAGDGLWFWIGRKWGAKAMRLLCHFSADPRSCSRRAEVRFRRYGMPLICVAKFVPGLDALMPPLVGAERVPFARFLALDAAGSTLWSAAYAGLGFFFSNQLDVAIRWVQHSGTALGIAIVVPPILYGGWRGLILVRMICELRQRRITPPVLARKLESGSRVAVLDLANFEAESAGDIPMAIPGAFVVDPSRLRTASQVAVPDDVKIIVYSPSGSRTVSARAAVGLKRIGVDKVWVLEGGLKAWQDHGLPVSQSPELPEVVAERFGIKLPPHEPGDREELMN